MTPAPDHGSLTVVMYHYVRDLPRTPWPRINGVLTDEFSRHVEVLSEQYEMATLDSAVDFLEQRYQPKRPLCLLTFDDGLKEHYTNVTPILESAGIQGVFLVHTSGPEEGRVAAVHKNHFLLASLSFEQYRDAFLDRLLEEAPGVDLAVAESDVRHFYRWDTLPVATLKYIINHRIRPDVRGRILDELFLEHVSEECAFARDLYLSWDEAREMQRAGMVVGGHSHEHGSLAGMAPAEQDADVTRCASLIRSRLEPQTFWPFSYPYGAYDTASIDTIRGNGFTCAFTTERGANLSETDLFRIRRMDPKDVIREAVQPCMC